MEELGSGGWGQFNSKGKRMWQSDELGKSLMHLRNWKGGNVAGSWIRGEWKEMMTAMRWGFQGGKRPSPIELVEDSKMDPKCNGELRKCFQQRWYVQTCILKRSFRYWMENGLVSGGWSNVDEGVEGMDAETCKKTSEGAKARTKQE